MLKKNLANLITLVRIIGTGILIFLPPMETAWLIVYGICGVSDVLDGTVARMLGTTTRFGSRLDSASDLFFYSVMLIRLFPLLLGLVPTLAWCIVGGVVLVRLVDYGLTAFKFHHLAATHSLLNKLSGFMVFMIPYTMNLGKWFIFYAYSICGVTAAAAVQELIYHIKTHPGDEVRI